MNNQEELANGKKQNSIAPEVDTIPSIPGQWAVKFRGNTIWFRDPTLQDQIQYRSKIARLAIEQGLDVHGIMIADSGLYAVFLARAFTEFLLSDEVKNSLGLEKFMIDDWEDLGMEIILAKKELDSQKKN